jgi:predicted ester cyclase
MTMDAGAVAVFLQRYAVDPWQTGDLRSLDGMVAEGFLLHPDSGLDDLKEAIRSTREALPDLTVAVEDSISEGDKIAYRWRMQGTFTADDGHPESGRTVTFTGITMLRLQGDKVAEDRYESSSPSLEQQLAAEI